MIYGRIYKITSPNTDKVYIGATKNPLSRRFTEHKAKRNNCSSKIIIEAGDAKIELIEEFICDINWLYASDYEWKCVALNFLKLEKSYIQRYGNSCVNIVHNKK